MRSSHLAQYNILFSTTYNTPIIVFLWGEGVTTATLPTQNKLAFGQTKSSLASICQSLCCLNGGGGVTSFHAPVTALPLGEIITGSGGLISIHVPVIVPS